MSSKPKKRTRAEQVDALIDAGREYSTAALMLHQAVADRSRLGVTDLKTLDVLQRVGPLGAGEIAAHTGLTSASVTSLIDRLEASGFVRRVPDPSGDRRRVVVEPTDKLSRAVAPRFQALNRRMRARFERYSEAEMELVGDFLLRGADEMREEAAKLGEGSEKKRGR